MTRRVRRSLIFLGVVLLLLVVAVALVQPLLERRARALVVEKLQGHTHPEQVSKLKVEIQLWRGRVVVRDLEVSPEQIGSKGSADRTVISYTVPEFELDLSLWRLLFGHVQLELVRLLHPHVRLEAHPHEKRGEDFNLRRAVSHVREALSGYMSTIGVGDLEIVDAKLDYVMPSDTADWGFTLEHLDIALRGLEISKGVLDAPAHLPLNEFRISFGAQDFVSRNGRSRVHLERFTFSFAGDSLAIVGLRGEMAPKEDSAHSGRAPMRLSMDELRFHGLGLEGALTGDTLVARRIELIRPDIRADLLLRKGHGRSKDTVLAAQHTLWELLPPMRLDTLEIMEGRVELVQGDAPLLRIGRIDVRLLNTRSVVDAGDRGVPFAPPTGGMLFLAEVKGQSGTHTVALDSMRLAITPHDLFLHGLSLGSTSEAQRASPEIAVAHLSLNGFDVAAWVEARAIEVDKVALSGIDLRIPSPFQGEQAPKPKRQGPIKEAKTLVPSLIARVGISRLRVTDLSLDGSWALTGHAHSELTGSGERFTFRAQGVRCPERPDEPHRDLCSDRAELRMHAVRFDDRAGALALHMGDLVASTVDRSVHLRNVRMRRASKNGTVMDTDELLLEGFDLPALMEERGLRFRKFMVNNRELKMELAEAPRDSTAPPATMPVIARYFHADTIDVRTGKLVVERAGNVVATVDSFRFELFNIRPDPPRFREERLAFLKDGPRFSGRRLRIAPPGGGFRISVERLDVDMLVYQAELLDIAVRVDRPGLQVDAKIPSITSTQFVPEFVETTDVLALGHLVINDARIDVMRSGKSERTRPASTNGRPKPLSYSLIHAGGVALRNARLSVTSEAANKERRIITGTLNASLGAIDQRLIPDGGEPLRIASTRSSLDHLLIAGPGEQDTVLAFSEVEVRTDAIVRGRDDRLHVDGLQADLGPFDLAYAHDSMRCHVGGVRYAHDEASLLVHGIRLRPSIPQEVFASAQRYRTDALVVDLDTVLATGLDVREVIAERKYVVPHLLVSGVHINDLRDHRLPFAPYREKPLPSRLLRNLEAHFGVDTIDVRNMSVAYAEIAKDGGGIGRIGLSQMRIRMLGVNAPARGLAVPLSVEATGLLQEQGRFALNLLFEPGHERDLFRYRFDLGPMDLRAFDAMLTPVAHLTIKKGRSDTLTVTAECNNDVALGELQMYFDDLHLALLGKRSQSGKGVFPKLESWVANAVVRTHRRPGHHDNPSTVYFERLKDRSLFNYLIKMTISGVPGALRLPDKKGKARRSDEEELKELLQEEGHPPRTDPRHR